MMLSKKIFTSNYVQMYCKMVKDLFFDRLYFRIFLTIDLFELKVVCYTE